MTRLLPAVIAAAVLAVPPPTVAADEERSKRTEGRYFVELSEIFLSAEDFDIEIAEVDPGGPGAGAEAFVVAAEQDAGEPISPRVTIGLNRPGGKTTFSASLLDFDLESKRRRDDFDTVENVVTPLLLPPGIGFVREAGFASGFPNWANEFTFNRAFDLKMAEFTVERNVFENERFRLRWLAGLRFAQLDQGLESLTTYTPVVFRDGGVRFSLQDFLTVSSSVTTNGFGPKAGLEARWLLGGEKRWSVEAEVDTALIPEKTRARYQLGLFGTKLIAGIDPAELQQTFGFGQLGFNAVVEQEDFTEETFQYQGRLAVTFSPKSFFEIGVELWHLRWHDVLSQIGVIDTIHAEATYEFRRGAFPTPDPDLDDSESVIHVPRFTTREDFAFQGIALNLKFDF